MPIDLKSLKKLETLSPSDVAKARDDDEELLVLVKVRSGAAKPGYITPRAEFGNDIFSAKIHARDLARIEADPDVESVSVSKELPLLD